MIRHDFFAFDYSGEDILLGTDFLSLVAPFAFFPEGFSYTIHNPMDGTSHVFQVPWVEKHSIFGEGEKRKIKKYPIHKFETHIKKFLECCAEVPNQFWAGEQYFVSLPYKDGWTMPHQIASHPGMSHDEDLRRTEIQALMDLKLIEPSKSHSASPTFYVNKHLA